MLLAVEYTIQAVVFVTQVVPMGTNIGSSAKVAMKCDERDSYDKIALTCKGRSKSDENPTSILPNKADSIHL